MTRIVDLSIPLDNEIPADPPFQPVEIAYTAHPEGAAEMVAAFPGLEVSDLPEGQGWAVEKVNISTHNGTHMDAPWHYHPTQDGGAPAVKIDEIPLDWCMRPGVKLDFREAARRPRRHRGGDRRRARPDRLRAAALRHRPLQHAGGGALRRGRLPRLRLRLRPRGDPPPGRAGDQDRRHRRLVLGRPLLGDREALRRDRRRLDHLGGPQGRPRARLLPAGEAPRPRAAPRHRLHRHLLPGEDHRRERRLDPLRRRPALR